MLVGKTKGLGLDIPQALFFFSFYFFRSWLNSPAHCCQACLYARLRKYLSHKGSSTVEISPCIFVCVCAVSSSSCLHNFRVFLRNCCKKGTLGDTYLLFRCAHCADLPEHLPWRCSVLAPEFFGNTCFARRWEETEEGWEGVGRLCLHMSA